LLVRAEWEHGRWPAESVWAWWRELQSKQSAFWVYPVTLAVINPVLALASNANHLWHRSRRLEADYRARIDACPRP
jgi:hypothetical protein